MDPRESNVEEGPDVVDGDARRLQDVLLMLTYQYFTLTALISLQVGQ